MAAGEPRDIGFLGVWEPTATVELTGYELTCIALALLPSNYAGGGGESVKAARAKIAAAKESLVGRPTEPERGEDGD